jgi:hypothetical protein
MCYGEDCNLSQAVPGCIRVSKSKTDRTQECGPASGGPSLSVHSASVLSS